MNRVPKCQWEASRRRDVCRGKLTILEAGLRCIENGPGPEAAGQHVGSSFLWLLTTQAHWWDEMRVPIGLNAGEKTAHAEYDSRNGMSLSTPGTIVILKSSYARIFDATLRRGGRTVRFRAY